MAITAVLQSAYNTMVKLSDGSITSMGRFQQAPGGRTITGILRGAYAAQVQNSAGVTKSLASHTQAAEGATIARIPTGSYGGIVVDGGIKSIAQIKQLQEVALAALDGGGTIEEAERVLLEYNSDFPEADSDEPGASGNQSSTTTEE